MPLDRFARVTRGLHQRSTRRTRVLFAGNPLPMWIYDVNSLRFLEVNESAENQYGYTRTEFLALTLNDITPEQDMDGAQDLIHGEDSGSACIHLRKDGTRINVWLQTNEVRFRGRHGRYVVAENITEWLQLHAKLLQLAHHDALTGLPNRVSLEAHMHSTLERQQFRLDYQLQYSMDGQIRGMEALLRVPDLNLGPIGPDRFVPMAEENGLIHPIGKWVLEEACRQLMVWNSRRRTPISIAINLSPLQLMRTDFPHEVQEVISASGIDPAWLEMEISERVVVKFKDMVKPMEQLAAMGVRFAVDNFGTGYSSLQHLLQLPVSTLKLDRAFIQQLSDSSRSYSIVKAVISMAHGLNMHVIAEGIEHEGQVKVLRELGCDGIQGFFLSRPASPETLEALLLGR